MDRIRDLLGQRSPGGGAAEPISRTHGGSHIPSPRRLFVVVDRRVIISRGLSLWIGTLGPEFSSVAITGINDLNAPTSEVSAVILCTSAVPPNDDVWLREQVARARRRLPEAPIVLFAESSDQRLAESTARLLQLSGYIPTSSSLELAATALRLILAGGYYVPHEDGEGVATVQPAREHPQLPRAITPDSYDRLTTRQRAVLHLLELGLPNKIIGHRLGMSPSTVKAHVHAIIVKLNVRNRTEAALTRFAVSSSHTSVAPSAPTANHEDKYRLDGAP